MQRGKIFLTLYDFGLIYTLMAGRGLGGAFFNLLKLGVCQKSLQFQ